MECETVCGPMRPETYFRSISSIILNRRPENGRKEELEHPFPENPENTNRPLLLHDITI